MSAHGRQAAVMSRAAWRLFATQAGLVLLGMIGATVAPPGVARAVLLLPAIVWVPGRSLIAALGLARSAGAFLPALAVALSVVAFIAAGLAVNLVVGHVPFGTLPLATAAVLLPLSLWERTTATGATATGATAFAAARYGVALVAGIVAAGGVLWAVDHRLPTTAQTPYLAFSFGPPYAQLTGVVTDRPGDVLRLPVVVSASDAAARSGLVVTAQMDGKPTTATGPTPVGADGTATVDVTVPAGCLHQIRLVLDRGTSPLRSVDLYVDAPEGPGCGPG